MAITWRNVQAPEQGSANALYTNGVQTLLGGFDKVASTAKGMEDARKLLEQKANEDVLGQLQAAGVANSVSPELRNTLVAGQLSGLGGKELSTLAASISGQQTTNDNSQIARENVGLNNDKFSESKRQFDAERLLKEQSLNQNQSQFTDELGFKRDQLNQNQGQFDSNLMFEKGKFDYQKADDAIKNKIAASKAKGDNTEGMQEAYTALTTSDQFKTATPEQQVLLLAPFMDAKDSASRLLDTRPDTAKTGGGNAKGVDAALKPYFSDPKYANAEDQTALLAAANQGVSDNLKPEVVAAYKANQSDSAYLGNWIGGQDLPKYSASDIIDYAKAKGVDPFIKNDKTGGQGTAPISPEGQAARDRLRPPK